MSYFLDTAIQVSLNGSTWYKLTDHNRQPVEVRPELIETQNRMANGSLRKYVVAQKNIISTSWDFLPTKTSELADVGTNVVGGAWIESFYKSNVGIPIYLKVIQSEVDPDAATGFIPSDSNFRTAATGSKTYQVFITDFSKTLRKRTRVCDYVDINIEFTEI